MRGTGKRKMINCGRLLELGKATYGAFTIPVSPILYMLGNFQSQQKHHSQGVNSKPCRLLALQLWATPLTLQSLSLPKCTISPSVEGFLEFK